MSGGSSSTLTVLSDQLANHSDTISIDKSGGGVKVTLNGEVAQFEPGHRPGILAQYDGGPISSVEISSGDGNDTINVLRTPDWTSPLSWVSVVSRGQSVVNLGVDHSVQGIQGTTIISNDGGSTDINIDDSGDPASHAVTWGSMSEAGVSGYSALVGLTQGPVWYDNHGTSNVTVKTGPGGGTVDVPFTAVPTWLQDFGPTSVDVRTTSASLTVESHGPTTINVGHDHSVQDIRGPLLIQSDAERTNINVDNAADPNAQSVGLSSASYASEISFGFLRGLAPASIIFAIGPTPAALSGTYLTVKTGSGGGTVDVPFMNVATTLVSGGTGTINVQATSAPLTLMDTGPTTVNVGHNGSVQDIGSDLWILDDGGYTSLIVDNSADPAAHAVWLGSFWDDYGLGTPNPGNIGYIAGLAPGTIWYEPHGSSMLSLWVSPATVFNEWAPIELTYLDGQLMWV